MDVDVVVRATEDDIDWILELEREAISPPWTHGALLREMFKRDTYFVVAARNDVKLGFIIMRIMVDCCELLQIAVKHCARRQGIADLLMCSMLAHARSNAINKIFLEVRKSNDAALSLYKKHGFKFVRRRSDYYTNPVEDALIMSVLIPENEKDI